MGEAVTFPATRKELEAAGYTWEYSRPCKRCRAVLEFWRTPAGKWAPLEQLAGDQENRRVSHFSTCPYANEFRKRNDDQGKLFDEPSRKK